MRFIMRRFYMCKIIMPSLIDHTYLISARMRNFAFDEMTKFSKGASDKKSHPGWATQRGPRPTARLVATSHRLASCVIVST